MEIAYVTPILLRIVPEEVNTNLRKRKVQALS